MSKSNPIASVEWKLLLAASVAKANESDQARVRAALEEGREKVIDWDGVLRLADAHGTTSLLWLILNGNALVPPSVSDSLRERYEKNVHKSLFLARELIRVLDCVEAAGIEVIPYKGLVMSEAYYGDMALRQSGDMDMFVRRSDVRRIRRAVADLGYTPRVSVPDAAEEDYIASGYECTFDSAAGKNLLELQWALQPRFYAVDYDMDGLFDRAVNVSVAGRPMKTPAPEDLLIVLSVHAAKHVWGRLIWLCDIAEILSRGNLDWEAVHSRAREVGVERILRITFLLLQKFLGAAIPQSMRSAIARDKAAQTMADDIAGAVSAGVLYGEQQVSYFRLMMKVRERRIDRARFLMRLVFTPGPGEWEAVKLPRILFPLYRAVRMLRLAGRVVRA